MHKEMLIHISALDIITFILRSPVYFVYNMYVYVVPHSTFKGQDIHTSFDLLQDNFIKELAQHNVNISMVAPAVKYYCYLTSQESSTLTTPANLITWMKNLPYHNCLNLSVLEHCAINMGLRYLFELIEEYKQTFFTKKFLDLFPSGECKDIQIEILGNHFYVIKSRELYIFNSFASSMYESHQSC